MKLKVLDTNILLSDANNLTNIAKDGDIVVLPETVLDELDSKKSGFEEINFQAREVGRLLTEAEDLGSVNIASELRVTKFKLNDTIIWVVAANGYGNIPDNTPINIINDRKIISIAVSLKLLEYDVEFVTLDVMCRIRAESLGVKVNKTNESKELVYTFYKEIAVPLDVFSTLNNKDIKEIDSTYSQENYNYMFTCIETGQTILATISNNRIDLIDSDTEKELKNQKVRPQNSGQLFLAKAIQDCTTELVIAEAKAGTGKTLCAISNAIRLVHLGKYSGIIYVRASVDDLPKEEQIGFLAGNAEKLEPYLHPLEDSLDFIVRENSKASKLRAEEYELFVKEEINKLKTKFNITGMIGLGMRGRTFRDSVVIIDEVQNQNPKSLQKVLTRIGKGSKVILCGSNAQIDNPYVSKYTNGLSKVLEASKLPNDIKIHAVKLPKIVRSKMAEWAENVFEKSK